MVGADEEEEEPRNVTVAPFARVTVVAEVVVAVEVASTVTVRASVTVTVTRPAAVPWAPLATLTVEVWAAVSTLLLDSSSPDAALSESSVVDSELPVLETTVEPELLSESVPLLEPVVLSPEVETRSVETWLSTMGESVS